MKAIIAEGTSAYSGKIKVIKIENLHRLYRETFIMSYKIYYLLFRSDQLGFTSSAFIEPK